MMEKWKNLKAATAFQIFLCVLQIDYGFETHLRDIFLPVSFQMKNNDDMRL